MFFPTGVILTTHLEEDVGLQQRYQQRWLESGKHPDLKFLRQWKGKGGRNDSAQHSERDYRPR